MDLSLSTPLQYVKGIGPSRGEALAAKGLDTVEDLLHYPPFRYEDRSRVRKLSELAPGEMATVIAHVRSVRAETGRRRGPALVHATFSDGSRMILSATWFNAVYLGKLLELGMKVSLFGKVELDTYTGRFSMTHPDLEVLPDEDEDSVLHTGRIVPVYQAVGKFNARMFRTVVDRVLGELPRQEDFLPPSIRRRMKLIDYWKAIIQLHFPPPGTGQKLLAEARTDAHSRLIFEELFWLQCGLIQRRNENQSTVGIAFEPKDSAREKIKQMLPFKPTNAQKHVLKEIVDDMMRPRPMNRLLQGDVGSGKTLVAAEAAVLAIENGYQVALLAPTEILATQHFLYFRRLFAGLGYVVVSLTGSQTAAEKRSNKKALTTGYAHVAIGTHALLEEDVGFRNLGLVIIDEQHRFGVLQRQRLMQKGVYPDVLVMTATPIPRTLALTLYGDLDVSVIDELPPGRRPIETRRIQSRHIEAVWRVIDQQILEGRQAYIVYPTIEESEALAVKAATESHQHLSAIVFPERTVGLLHGKLSPQEKEEVMRRFQEGEIQILVTTTVIEVGVDVPNASVMVIEHADRFGLAQLHQLRGRVGRGPWQSHCILVTGKASEAGEERVRAMTETTDGFVIAETDLRLRGPGEFFGTRQAGMPTLRIADLIRDREILEDARREAESFLASPPTEEERARAEWYLREKWQKRFGLVEVA